ncbi:MAG: thioesterase domain-containing protein, partial [Candidatus Acidiferrales bacterium]
TLQGIATCLACKILATQSEGPYTIGGFCVGGILAYEIASQLQAAGHEVSLLVLVDAPNPAYLELCDSLARKVSYLRYALKRAARLGLRMSLVYLGERLRKRFARTRSARTEMRVAQEMSEAAAFAYQPERYEGKVLLLLASERPPHVNFLPGWQAVVPRNLHTQYLDGHHRDLLKAENVPSIGHAIVSHLMPATYEKSLSCCANTPGSRGSGANGESDKGMSFDKTEGDGRWRSNLDAVDSMSEEETKTHSG